MIFFNSSMPRSGSELLQVILHQNPAIYASPTSPLLEYQFGARSNLELPEVQSQPSELMQSAFASMCRGMADSYYSAITDRPNICDKNRGWLHYFEWVQQWNTEPKMICMVRDLRDVLASMEKIYRSNRGRPIGPDNPQAMEGITVLDRVNHWTNSQPIGLALNRLADCFQRGIDSQILFVRYEDLCNSPESVMRTIYQYIGIQEYRHDFANIKKEVQENDSLFGPYGSHAVAQRIRPSVTNAWLSVFDESIGSHIAAQHDWFFRVFGYEQ
jgi:sulfotransferase